MQTEFTCGIYTAIQSNNIDSGLEWLIRVNLYVIATISNDGQLMLTTSICPLLSVEDLLQIAVLMNNIKHQYKHLQFNI